MKKSIISKRYLFFLFLFLLLQGNLTHAAEFSDDVFEVQIPEGWEMEQLDIPLRVPASVAHILDCVTEDAVKIVGWTLDENGAVQGAYCITWWTGGAKKARTLITESQGKEKEAVAEKMVDIFAGTIHQNYVEKRGMTIEEMSSDMVEAENDVIVILDSRIRDNTDEYMHSSTFFLHDDRLLSINSVYGDNAPVDAVQELEAIPLSVKWK